MITFPNIWVDASKFENVLNNNPSPHDSSEETVFRFPPGCKIMIDAAVRLLSPGNQLDNSSHSVCLLFEGGQEEVMSYLDRMGFFDHLHSRVRVLPTRPASSAAELYGGANVHLVEIAPIRPSHRDESLPEAGRYSDRGCANRSDVGVMRPGPS